MKTSMTGAEMIRILYRWRMRAEQGYWYEKSGCILREGSDQHQLKAVLHLHRLLLANLLLHWLAALTGLQAHHALPQSDQEPMAPATTLLEQAPPHTPEAAHLLKQGPAQPPPVIPHRGPAPRLARWLRRFAVRGHLSYVRLGLEILRLDDLGRLVRRAVHWLGIFLWPFTPLWTPRQLRYRLLYWWPPPA